MDKKAFLKKMADFLDSIEADVKRQVMEDVQGVLGGIRKTKKANGTRDMGCIAPNCKNRSRGPRYRFLCEKHSGATDKQVMEWREARKG